MVGGRGVRLLAPLEMEDTDLFVALTADAGKRGARARSTVYLACPLGRADLEQLHPERFATRTQTTFDAAKERVAAHTETCFFDLIVERRPSGAVDEAKGAALLAKAAADVWPEGFSLDKTTVALLDRLAFAQMQMPKLGLPGVDKRRIRPMIEAACFGRRTLAEIRDLDWGRIIRDAVPFPVRRAFEEAFPERFETPAGSSVPLDYGPARSGNTPGPVLACRLQALFGLRATPRIAEHRIPVTVHLLAPNGRPCQITQDLESFWKNTYPEVRKELKGRYPKHYWPENPLSAAPTTRVRPRARRGPP
jgi:ATP-dependent helicase HrpB